MTIISRLQRIASILATRDRNEGRLGRGKCVVTEITALSGPKLQSQWEKIPQAVKDSGVTLVIESVQTNIGEDPRPDSPLMIHLEVTGRTPQLNVFGRAVFGEPFYPNL